MIGVWLFLASSLGAALPQPVALPAPGAVKAQTVTPGADKRLEQAALAIDAGKYPVALSLVSDAQRDGLLSEADMDWAAYLMARALAASGSTTDAEKVIRERQRAHPTAYTWASLVAVLAACGEQEDAAKLILALEDGEFILANRLKPNLIEAIIAALESSTSKSRDALVARLVEGRYTGPSSQRVPDGLRLRYINQLLRQNRTEDAARQTLSLEAPTILTILLTDKSFAPLWEMPALRLLLQPGALVARVDRGIQARLEQSALSPSDWLELMRALRVVGRADEAVRLGLHAIEQARGGKRAASPALRLEVANAYADMGEAWAARRTARELLKEQAELPVALRVAIARLLEITGDDEGALLLLATIEGSDRLAPALQTTVCAAHDLGRTERRDAALKVLEGMVDASPEDVMGAYVCSGGQEKAAKVLAQMFERPALRTAAILTAQLYADPSKPGSDQSDLRYRMRALVATEVVQAAVQAYARTMGLPFTVVNSN